LQVVLASLGIFPSPFERGSLRPLIAWHACHDFIGYATGNTVSGIAGVAAVVQIVLMAA